MISNGVILNERRHFSGDALELLALRSKQIAPSVLSGLIAMALKFQDYDNVKARVESIIHSLMMAHDTKVPMMLKITSSIECRTSESVLTATIEGMLDCTNNAVTALALLNRPGLENETRRLHQLFDHYLAKEEVAAWPGLFKAAHSIAIFIKFMSREDIEKSYRLFAERNTANADFRNLLSNVRCAHQVPVVRREEMEQIMKNGTSREAVEVLLQSIITRGVQSRNSDTQKIVELSVAWMRLMFAKITIPMAPKNTQIIAMLSCAHWLARSRNGSAAYIAQVGTGEGKSLIIAMLAVYCVTVLKKKVHVLENNIGLLEKDFSTFCSSVDKAGDVTQSFFTALNVTASKSLTAGADVTYCLRRDMETHYRDGVFDGKQPFRNTILIVDEVDQLIVDDDPNQSYVKPVTQEGQQVKEIFDLLIANNGNASRGPQHSAWIWNEVVRAYRQAQTKTEGTDYRRYGGSDIRLIWDRVVAENKYTLWLECLRYQADRSYTPQLQTTFFYQNMTHMMTRYDAIVGLSGSLGCPSERQFLRDTYQASTFEVPSFLDTCTDFSKHMPRLHRGVVEVHTSPASHTDAIIRVALEKFQTVPVLIVASSDQEATALAACLQRHIAKAQYDKVRGSKSANDFVQLFLKLDDKGQHMPWLNIIEKATEEAISPGLATRRITVTDPFGGRGHDFMVNDESADDHGGLMVIATLMPESERDWIQWKGRTARNDRQGQYAVILRASESPINNNEEILKDHHVSGTDYRPTLIDKLLELCDALSKSKIDSMKERVQRGQRLNELCDQFYARFNINSAGEWPGCPQNKMLSKFLEDHKLHTKDGIKQFAVLMGVNYPSSYDF